MKRFLKNTGQFLVAISTFVTVPTAWGAPIEFEFVEEISSPDVQEVRGITFLNDRMFISDLDEAGTIYELDKTNGNVINSFETNITQIIALTGNPDDGYLYVSGCCGSGLFKVDPNTGSVVGSISPEVTNIQGLSFYNGLFYASSNDTHELFEIDPLSGQTLRSISVQSVREGAFGGEGGINVNAVEVFRDSIFLHIDQGSNVGELHQFALSDLTYMGLSYFGFGSDASGFDGEFLWVEKIVNGVDSFHKLSEITNSPASLVERDLIVSGDGLVSFDESTRFEWLDLTATVGLGVTDIEAGEGGWIDAGWRYATAEEVAAMWAQLGITHREAPEDDYGEIDAVNRFFELFGLLENSDFRSSQGWTSERINGNYVAAAVSAWDGDLGELTYADTSNYSSSTGRREAFGNYLVRNEATVALADGPYSLDEGGALAENVNILDNDRDPEGDALTPYVVDPPDHASFFQVMPDGTFDYTHDGSETMSDWFTYRASDGINESEVATVSLSIRPVNDPPQIQLIGAETVYIDLGSDYVDQGASATDAEDGDLTSAISVTHSVDTNTIGNYVVTYTVEDSNSIQAQIERTVIVEAAPEPQQTRSGGGGALTDIEVLVLLIGLLGLRQSRTLISLRG